MAAEPRESDHSSVPNTNTNTNTKPDNNEITIQLAHNGQTHTLTLPSEFTISDLSTAVATTLSIPPSNQKFIIPQLGLLKPPFKDASLPLSPNLTNKKTTLMGSPAATSEAVSQASALATKRETALAAQRRAQPRAFTTTRASTTEQMYTFASFRALPHLPNPQRSLAFLKKLAADPGIVAAMRAHKFRVGLLTEMDPAAYTEESVEGTTRILGLNRDRGQAIELRLRTDAYDGYRDYRVIRKTLCHELAHNVFGEHDRQFWDLCHGIEREVQRADYKAEGRSLDGERVWKGRRGLEEEEEEGVVHDHGGWVGGQSVLGGGGAGEGTLSRREILARATEERLKKNAKEKGEGET